MHEKGRNENCVRIMSRLFVLINDFCFRTVLGVWLLCLNKDVLWLTFDKINKDIYAYLTFFGNFQHLACTVNT